MTTESKKWMEASDVIPTFPTLVWKVQVEADLRDALAISILEALAGHAARPATARTRPRLAVGAGAARTRRLSRAGCVRSIVASRASCGFCESAATRFEITGCWATVLAKGAVHKIHSHPNNFLSGVYYVQTRPGAADQLP